MFPGSDGTINIVDEIGVNYRQFGHLLLDDKRGAVVTALKEAHSPNPADITRAILQRWLDRKPSELTWSRLVKCLKDSGLETLASDIDKCLVD